jgi:outer membrane murein-binding lipoprotein Lpp
MPKILVEFEVHDLQALVQDLKFLFPNMKGRTQSAFETANRAYLKHLNREVLAEEMERTRLEAQAAKAEAERAHAEFKRLEHLASMACRAFLMEDPDPD